MSDAAADDDDREALGREVVDLARALRAELQLLNEGELRRQARLAAFDQQLAQMESSIRGEVERLRTTGAVVELLADLLRQSLGEVESDRRFEPIHDQLARLRDDVASLPAPKLEPLETGLASGLQALHDKLDALPQPDLSPLHEQLDQLHVRLAAIPTRDLRPIHDRLEALSATVAALPTPDDTELRGELQAIRTTISALPRPDLAAIEASLTEARAQISALPTVDLDPLHADVRRLQEELAAWPLVDLDPLSVQLQELRAQLHDLPRPDDSAVQSSVAGVAAQIADLRLAVDGLPAVEALHGVADGVERLSGLVAALPVHDDEPVREEVRRLAAELDGLRTAMADRFDALPAPAQVADLLSPALDQLGARIDRLPDHTDRVNALTSSREAFEREVAQLVTLVAEVADQTRPIAALESGLAGIRDAIFSLEAITGASVAGDREAADAQALALARVTAATDGFSSTVGTLRTAMVSAARAAGDETIRSIDEHVDAHLRAVESRLSAALEAGLRSLDPHPVHEHLRELDERITALALPDLGPIATQLGQLNATISAEIQVRPADASQLDAIRDQLTSLAERVDRAAADSERAAQVALQLLEATTRPPTIKKKAPAKPSPAKSSQPKTAATSKAVTKKKAPTEQVAPHRSADGATPPDSQS